MEREQKKVDEPEIIIEDVKYFAPESVSGICEICEGKATITIDNHLLCKYCSEIFKVQKIRMVLADDSRSKNGKRRVSFLGIEL